MWQYLPNEEPFYLERPFESPDDTEKEGLYNEMGGNIVTFLGGLLQLVLPGVASSMLDTVQFAVENAEWPIWDWSNATSMGMRTAEFLQYHETGRLGTHEDTESIYSISIALSGMDAYEGGYFRLESGEALFKAPRLSALVFSSESGHGITPIRGGERNVLVAEIWDEDDPPLGLPRPWRKDFVSYKEERREVMERRASVGEEL